MGAKRNQNQRFETGTRTGTKFVFVPRAYLRIATLEANCVRICIYQVFKLNRFYFESSTISHWILFRSVWRSFKCKMKTNRNKINKNNNNLYESVCAG